MAAIFVFPLRFDQAQEKAPGSAPVWITVYYAGWSQKNLPANDIDMSAITHLIHFALVPNDDGTLNPRPNSLSPANITAAVTAAHSANRKILISIGGAKTIDAFSKAISPDVRSKFVQNIVAWTADHGYDGVDVDMEPLNEPDAANFKAFVQELHSALKSRNADFLLTAAAPDNSASFFTDLLPCFDQINVMTYSLSGTWPGWVVWHDAPLYNCGSTFPGGRKFPCCADIADQWIKAGIPAAKLGIGIAFFGQRWTGVLKPKDAIASNTTVAEVRYNEIMDKWYRPDRYHWDECAWAPYLSIADADPAKQSFISYDDEKLCAAKVQYAREHGLGGVIVFELGAGYRPQEPAGQRDILLQAVKNAVQK